MSWTPHVTVAVICQNAQGDYLIVEENSHGDLVINQPAGHVEAGETILQAAQRETLEETGWQVSLTAYLGLYVYTSPLNKVTYHRHAFIAEPVLQASHTLDTEIVRAFWAPLDDIIEYSNLRSPLVLQCFEDHRKGVAYPLHLIHE